MSEKSYRDQAWESRITSLENRLAGMGRGAFDEARDNERTRIELAGRIATLETQGTPADELASAVRDRLNQVEDDLAHLKNLIDGLDITVSSRISRLRDLQDDLKTRMDDAEAALGELQGSVTMAELFADLVQAGATSADATAIVIAWMQKE